MPDPSQPPSPEPDAHTLLLIVVGAHLHAERADRPLAHRLREAIVAWQEDHAEVRPLVPQICCDLWYVNHRELLMRPTISIGSPSVNAATAYLSRRLPTAFVIDRTLRIQLDPELLDLQACIWGVDEHSAGAAIDHFCRRYLDDFLDAIHAAPAAPA